MDHHNLNVPYQECIGFLTLAPFLLNKAQIVNMTNFPQPQDHLTLKPGRCIENKQYAQPYGEHHEDYE
jgi:hypothetical protein